jgi:hypothetical protein
MTLIIKSNASQGTVVVIDDWGVSIPASGGQEPFPSLDDQKSAMGSRDLLAYLTDNAHGASSSTLILNDSTTDIAQADVEEFLGSLIQYDGASNFGIAKNDSAGEIRQDLTTNAGSPSQLNNWQLGTALDANSFAITNLPAPSAGGDAANKTYVDAVAQGLDVKESVRAGTVEILDNNTDISGSPAYNNVGGTSTRGQITATLAVSGTFTVDGVAFATTGDRILIKNEGDGAGMGGDANGIWVVTIVGTALTLDRATDFDTDAEVTAAAFTFIEEGSTLADSGWVLTTDNPITIGGASGTVLDWSQFSGAGTINAGNGLTKSGSTIDVGVGSVGIIITADAIAVDYGEVGDVVGLGSTIAAGTLDEAARADHVHTHGDRGADSAGSQHDADQVDVEATLTTIGAPDTVEGVFSNIEALFNGGQKAGKTLQFGQTTNVPSGTGVLALIGGGVPSSAVGTRMLRAGTFTGASLQVDQLDTVRAYKLSIRINGSEVASVALSTSTLGNHDAGLSAAYAAGDLLSVSVERTSGAAAKSTFDDISALVEYTE